VTDPRIVSALREATARDLRDDAECMMRDAARCNVLVADDERPMLYRLAALALAVAEMQARAASAIPQNPERPHVIFWSADAVGGMDWIMGDAGVNGERTLPAALAALLEGGR
jgi:hypothetical protein